MWSIKVYLILLESIKAVVVVVVVVDVVLVDGVVEALLVVANHIIFSCAQ